MQIPRTRRDPSSNGDGPPTFVTDDTHWWDGSQIYGRDPAFAEAIKTGEHGKLHIDDRGLIPDEIESHVDLTGVAGNFWVGLALLHSLFMREHNAVCDHLHATHPELSDDELFDKARLVVSALMAKIHTVDWTPAIIAHPTTVTALRTNWWGLEGRRLDRLIGRRTSNEVIRGIPGSPTALHGVPYQLTEEFVAVYRMHPLIPDEFSFRSLADDHDAAGADAARGRRAARARAADRDVDGRRALFLRDVAPGRDHAAQLPASSCSTSTRPTARSSISPSTDILRVRERGVPRYNEFRRLLHLKAYDTFEEMADTPEHAADLRRIYRDPEEVDTMIGMYAEKKPKGFGFSDTAFRIFILMASRRIESDRFFTRDYRPEVYTKEGIDWVEDNSMRTLLLRHFPELEPALRGRGESVRPLAALGRVIELAPGIHSLGHGKGGHVHAFLIDTGGELSLVDTLFENDARLVLQAIHALGRAPSDLKRIAITHGHRSHLGGLARLKRESGATVYAHRWEADIVTGDRRAQPVSILPRQSLKLIPFQLGLWLNRPKHDPCPVDELLDDGDAFGPLQVLHAAGHSPGPPRVLVAGTELRDRRRRRRHLARALSRLACLQPEQETASRDAAAPGRPRGDDRRRRPRRSADPGRAGGAPRARGEAGPLINRRTRSTLSGLLRLV